MINKLSNEVFIKDYLASRVYGGVLSRAVLKASLAGYVTGVPTGNELPFVFRYVRGVV